MSLNKKYIVLFVLSAVLTLATHWILFAVSNAQPVATWLYISIEAIYFLSLMLTLLLWLFYPSKVIVAIVILSSFILPDLLFYSDTFLTRVDFEYSFKSLLLYLIPTFLFVLATEFRLRMDHLKREATRVI